MLQTPHKPYLITNFSISILCYTEKGKLFDQLKQITSIGNTQINEVFPNQINMLINTNV